MLEHQSIRRLVNLAFLFISLACCVVACQTNDERPEIKIGLMTPLTGEGITSGQSMIDAANLAVQEINAAGDLVINGRRHQVVLIVEDNQGDPEESVRIAEKLIHEDEVVALVGPPTSRSAIPVAEVAEAARVSMITPTSSNPETTRNKHHVFRVIATDDFQGEVIAQFAAKTLGVRRAAVLYDRNDAYNRGLARVFRRAFERQGGQVVAFEAYITGEQDFRPYLQQIQAQNPALIFLPNRAREVPEQAEQARELGITTPFIGADTWSLIEPDRRAILEGAFFTTSWSLDIAGERTHSFIETYQQRYGQAPDSRAALTYDAFGLLFQAIKSQKSIERRNIQKGLAITDPYSGVTGTIEYLGNGDPIRSLMIMQIQQNEYVFYQQVVP